MFKFYRKANEAQYRWIREHPVQYITLNVIVLVVFFGYIEYKDRKEMRELKNETAPQQ